MEYTERNLEDVIFEQGYIMVDNKRINIISRQVKVGNFRLDLLGVDNEGNLYVFELKKGMVDGNALSQVLCYMWYIISYLKSKENKIKVYGVLIGNSISDYLLYSKNLLENIYCLEAEPTFMFLDENYTWFTKKDNSTKTNFLNLLENFNNIFNRGDNNGD